MRINWTLITIPVLITLSFWLMDGLVNDWGRLSGGGQNLFVFIERIIMATRLESLIEPQAYPVCTAYPPFDFTCSTAWIGMTETIKIAFISTVFGTMFSLPISILASRNLNSVFFTIPSRFILAACRSLPSIIWAIFFVILVGFGPLSGILAMTIYTVGYLGKLQYESIEGMSNMPLESADSMGLSKIEKAIGVVIPEQANQLDLTNNIHVRIQCKTRDRDRHCRCWWNWLLHQPLSEISTVR